MLCPCCSSASEKMGEGMELVFSDMALAYRMPVYMQIQIEARGWFYKGFCLRRLFAI